MHFGNSPRRRLFLTVSLARQDGNSGWSCCCDESKVKESSQQTLGHKRDYFHISSHRIRWPSVHSPFLDLPLVSM